MEKSIPVNLAVVWAVRQRGQKRLVCGGFTINCTVATMSEESTRNRFCTECGSKRTGRFCAACGDEDEYFKGGAAVKGEPPARITFPTGGVLPPGIACGTSF